MVEGTAVGHSVINLSIKVAYWMGIREIYIMGADHHYVVPDIKTGERLMNNDVLRSNGEKNHFHPDYNPPGEELTVPLLDLMEAEFQETKEIFEAAGGRILNASRFSKLEVFERIDFDDIAGL